MAPATAAGEGKELDEEALVHLFPQLDRKALGAFFTPAPLVQRTLALALPHLRAAGPLAVVDPACGAGAFLAAAARHRPDARLLGLELCAPVARACQARVPSARVHVGDALREDLDRLLAAVPAGAQELWLANPPFNGTSALLQDPAAYARLRALLPRALPAGTSLRDDFVFFLLRAAHRLATREGVLAFITPASLLDAFLYAPVRAALLETLSLRDVVDLGTDAFHDAHVHTCLSVWASPRPRRRAPILFSREGQPPLALRPQGPEWLLTPVSSGARALDARWRAQGEPLTQLVPVSLPGVKTRFDELLVDADPACLLARVEDFSRTPPEELADFAHRHGLPAALLPKLGRLRAAAGPLQVEARHLRPFFRYRGAHHRGQLPPHTRAWCYLDRRLIPRGDHRLRGVYDPHAEPVKLLFNVRELPLSAALLEEPGCVHDHRHARFAPLRVPLAVREHGLAVTRGVRDPAALGPLVPNLSARGRAWAERLGGPRELFGALVRFLNGPEVQELWAPAYGATRVVPVPERAVLGAHGAEAPAAGP